ncbi:MAG TPA: DUF3540 domain-containing protein [Burkholderiaceae bacterium]|nr:DUF3540 domain-containing protein [Burkholderiaceae bacterium]
MQNTLISMSRPGLNPAVGLSYATITGRSGNWFFLNAVDAAAERALRAESCLVDPECGDTVLLCNSAAMGGHAYILAVLVRAETANASLSLPGGVALRTSHGKLHVDAERVELAARDSLSLQAPKINMAGLSADMTFHRLSASAQEVQGRFGMVSTVAQSITSTVERLVQKTRDSFRWIENLDETRAGRVRLQVQERYHLKAKHASVLADGQVKIDGDKIDLG